jgi:hypothetical protein
MIGALRNQAARFPVIKSAIFCIIFGARGEADWQKYAEPV